MSKDQLLVLHSLLQITNIHLLITHSSNIRKLFIILTILNLELFKTLFLKKIIVKNLKVLIIFLKTHLS